MSKDNNSDEDSDLFRQMMSDVKPLPAEDRVAPDKPRPVPKRRTQAPAPHQATGFAEREYAPDVAPEEPLFFARIGLQHRVQRRLKHGDFPIEATLDLHGCTIAEAGQQLDKFLHSTTAAGLRCICVIHGKGHRSADGRSVLKSQVNFWLRDSLAVMAFCSAQPRHGGTGAVYVLLRRQS